MRDFLTMTALLLSVLLQAWMDDGYPMFATPSYARAADVGAGCPADRPHSRRVVDMAGTITCTAVAVKELVCPKSQSGGCYYRSVQQCDAPPSRMICLSDQELRDAQAR